MRTDAPEYKNFPSQDSAQLYEDEADRRKHLAYITSIANDKHRDISEVAPFYENILCDLRSQARVHDYLNVFVAKKVVEQLKTFQ